MSSDIEMSFIRTLSVNGVILSGTLSVEERRERIRVAIIQQRLAVERYSEQLTYAQAYQRCYDRPLEMRRVERDAHQRPTDILIPEEDDVEDEDFGDCVGA
jgi:hypothetical protein